MILATGAESRSTGNGRQAVVCMNGGRAAAVPGTWSATIEWLVSRLAPRFPELRFLEVRYRVKSWRHLEDCIADARAAIAEAGPRTLLLGFSMGGAVSIACAGEPEVAGVLGLAPWIPDRLPVEPLRGKRLRVLHGSLDRALPGVPGVSPELAPAGLRARPRARCRRGADRDPRRHARGRPAGAVGRARPAAARNALARAGLGRARAFRA